jgi:group I intron endonuclease
MIKAPLKSCIYLIENHVTGKVYVGSAQNFRARSANHMQRLSSGNHHSVKLQNSFNKYGAHNFSIRPILYCSEENLIFYEQRAIDAYQSCAHGYNVNPVAGSNLGRKWSAEVRAKMSMSRKGVPLPRSGESRRGRIASEEHRLKISKALTGKPKTLAHKKALALSALGRTVSDEAREKMSLSRIGTKQSVETIEKRIATRIANRVSRQ